MASTWFDLLLGQILPDSHSSTALFGPLEGTLWFVGGRSCSFHLELITSQLLAEEFQAGTVLIPDVTIPVSICFQVGSAGLHCNVKHVKLINHKLMV